MPIQGKTKIQAEFGDFQTPKALAKGICALLVDRGLHPAGVLEPTCGRGAFLDAATRTNPGDDGHPGYELYKLAEPYTKRADEEQTA